MGDSSAEDLGRKVDHGLGWRHVMVALVFFVIAICYADRTNIGIVLAQQDLPGIPHSEKGTILSAFFVGYAPSQLLGGMAVRRWGFKVCLLLAALLWTACDVLTPFLAMYGLSALYAGRVGVGMGEGFVFPSQMAVANVWVPSMERATLVAAMSSGQEFGSLAANLLSPLLLHWGPLAVFMSWGGLALVWSCIFAGVGAVAPERHDACCASGEAAWITSSRGAAPIDSAEGPLPARLLRAAPVWAIVSAHCGCNYVWYVVLSWMPTYFAERHGVNLQQKPYMLAVPYLAAVAGVNLAGRCSDAAIMRGAQTRHVRKSVQFLATVGLGFFMQLSARATSASWATCWMSVALFFGRMQTAAFWVNMADICPQSAPTLMGISNSVASIPGIVGQPLTEALLDSYNSWSLVFAAGWWPKPMLHDRRTKCTARYIMQARLRSS